MSDHVDQRVAELKVLKRIDADRVGRVLKQDRESMRTMSKADLQKVLDQAEADMTRCYDASATLREVGNQLADVMIDALGVATDRGLKIR
ncbi:hypothetical protein KNU14_gp16 [Gordonia phage Buggaboo]|uniref:Uncharacterized protein n=1 Tax=Gordonia phage Buggaboo TaxID=2315529 RepID=A0A386KCA1_9CAUD|nr:hypothetical protein KNU14_gp16 [Gordonia phage Buggaboo]AVE00675.1 hypothetical protein SEA_SUPERSULLEY_16 [Gordonia phage SuperSulley]AYD83208.1 hypothetical protein SEA_BUGGABOO_16 [Gordonia phage Buggaboo]